MVKPDDRWRSRGVSSGKCLDLVMTGLSTEDRIWNFSIARWTLLSSIRLEGCGGQVKSLARLWDEEHRKNWMIYGIVPDRVSVEKRETLKCINGLPYYRKFVEGCPDSVCYCTSYDYSDDDTSLTFDVRILFLLATLPVERLILSLASQLSDFSSLYPSHFQSLENSILKIFFNNHVKYLL